MVRQSRAGGGGENEDRSDAARRSGTRVEATAMRSGWPWPSISGRLYLVRMGDVVGAVREWMRG